MLPSVSGGLSTTGAHVYRDLVSPGSSGSFLHHCTCPHLMESLHTRATSTTPGIEWMEERVVENVPGNSMSKCQVRVLVARDREKISELGDISMTYL